MSKEYTYTVERERHIREDDVVEEVELTVEYTIHGGSRGARDSLGGKAGAGPPLEPDTDPEVEILSVTDKDGLEVTLTVDEEESIVAGIWEQVVSEKNDYPEPDSSDE